MRVLSTQEMVVKVAKALKKDKNSILHVHLGPIGETHRKKIVLMGDNIDGGLTKI